MRNLKLLGLSLACTFSLQTFAFNQGVVFHKNSLESQNPYSKKLQLRVDGSLRLMETAFFDQKLDHKNSEGQVTFKQRYFVDSQYAKDNTSPIFFIICGEWNCAGTGSYGFAEGLAKKMNAHLIALEHRYYGESLPMTSLTTENLQHLNLDAAIEDLATFQRHMMSEKNLTGKWISFGGSYAGTLAAFYRLKHPELTAGALASSAPVLMKPDFFEYDAHIAKVISATSCGYKVREAINLIEDKIETAEGLAEVKALFSASEIVDKGDFLYAVADMLAAAVQYGRHKVFCETLLSNPDLIAGYAEGGLKVLNSLGMTAIELSFQSAEKIETTPSDYFRQWMWQSCQEFGWFQVSNTEGTTARSSKIDLNLHANACVRLYNTPMRADGSMNQNWYLQLLNPETSHIIFSNGANDPWQTLSLTSEMEQKNPAFDLWLMESAAHCNDLRAISSIPSVVAAQLEMSAKIQGWLQE